MANQVSIKFPCPEHGVAFAKNIHEDRSNIIVCYAPKLTKYSEVDPHTGEVIEKERISHCWYHMSGYNVKKKGEKLCADCKEKPRVDKNAYCRECKNRRHRESRAKNIERFRKYNKKYRSKRRVAA